MAILTEQQEQEMIDRAKAGDPKANYEMSLWALDQAIAEPEEERWNRLAAKCLVRAADAGYGPAQERMDQLINGQPTGQSDPVEQERSVKSADSSFKQNQNTEGQHEMQSAQPDHPSGKKLRTTAVGHTALHAVARGGRFVAGKSKEFMKKRRTKAAESTATQQVGTKDALSSEPQADPSPDQAASNAKGTESQKFSFLRFSQWDDAQWKKMQKICVAVCIILVILIVILLVTGNRNRKEKIDEDVAETLVEDVTETTAPTATPAPADYPSAAVREEIQSASLDVYPSDSEYVSEETTLTITAGSGLKLRTGPDTDYNELGSMDYNTVLEVFALKDDWALVRYNGNTWGWCNADYLQ